MELREDEKTVLVGIAQTYASNIQGAIASAYEAGILEGALRMTRMMAKKAIEEQASHGEAQADAPDTMTSADAAWLRAQGIDPTKKFRHRNAYFTITGVKQSRWKFPVTACSVRGTSYKWSLETVKQGQR